MMNIIDALRASSKGQLRYDNHWNPTAESLNQCTSPPLVDARVKKLGLYDENHDYDLSFSKNLRAGPGFSPSLPKKIQVNEAPTINDSLPLSASSSSTDDVNFFDISVAIHHYNSNKKQEVIAKSLSRREIYEKHSQNLLKEEQETLRELQEIDEQRFLMAVEAIQKDERKRTAESNKRQEKLFKDHQEHAARADRNVKHAEAMRKQIEEDKNKQEIEKLQILVQELKNAGLGVHKSVKEFKHQKHLPAATSEVLHEIDKILQMSAETIENAKRSGRPSEQDKKFISAELKPPARFRNKTGMALNKAYFFVSFLVQIQHSYLEQNGIERNTSAGTASGIFQFYSHHYLQVPVLSSVFVYDDTECSRECLREINCFSFNVAVNSEQEKNLRVCELLATTNYYAQEKFTPRSSFHHFVCLMDAIQFKETHSGFVYQIKLLQHVNGLCFLRLI